MEAVSMPSTEEKLEAAESSEKEEKTSEDAAEPCRVNGDVNGSSAGEEDSVSDMPPAKKPRLASEKSEDSPSAKKTANSPVVIELADSPLKNTRSSRRKLLEKDSESESAEVHKNGAADTDDPSDCEARAPEKQPSENGDSATAAEDEEVEGEGEVETAKEKEVKDVEMKSEDDIQELKEGRSCSPEIEEINDDDIQEVDSSGDPLDMSMNGPSKNGETTPGSTPDKSKDAARRKSAEAKEAKRQALLSITPRRSSRNVHKQKKYVDGESDPESDIEEILPTDPLAVSSSERVRFNEKDPLGESPSKEVTISKVKRKHTIVVNDTKALAQIAATSKEGKKEPTLVIIDTNSILSGRGPVPITASPPNAHQSSSLPSALPAQGVYPVMHPHVPRNLSPLPPKPQQPAAPPKPKGPIGLTDDMYVVEAPSFIVPYVYEKPPKEPLKEVVEKMAKALKEEEKREREEEKLKKKKEREEQEKKKAEGKEKEKEKEKEGEDKDAEKKDEESSDEKESKKEKKEGEDSDMEVDEETKPTSKKKEVKEADPDYKVEADSTDSTKEKDSDEEDIEYDSESDSSASSKTSSQPRSTSYFDSPLGKFFMQIGVNLVQEHVQTDLLRLQKRKLQRGGVHNNPETQLAVHSLLKNLEQSKENNEPYKFKLHHCKFCNFKTESQVVLQHHLEIPHLKNFMYHCNLCSTSVRTSQDILFHVEAEHNVHGRIERAPAFHQCPNCPFEDNQKSKMNRHAISCTKRFRPEKNCEPPAEWEPPAKIPRMAKSNMYRPVLPGQSPGSAQQYANAAQRMSQHPLMPKLPQAMMPSLMAGSVRGRGRPTTLSSNNRYLPDLKAMPRAIAPSQMRQGGMMYQQTSPRQQVLLPNAYQIAGNQIYQRWSQQVQSPSSLPAMPRLTLLPHGSGSSTVAIMPSMSSGSNSITIQQSGSGKSSAAKLLQQPSISITPLPRQPSSSSGSFPGGKHPTGAAAGIAPNNKNSFVICEICDGYIKDLEQLRNHMQWIHKVKIHPKMIYNRPPLNCQKCQFRFFTDQGLERHLLGSHGLVTSSMQEASNKGKDGGRCPVCGRVYQWKLLNHVAKDHNMTLKPAHLSYKCTVCTATFGMYKQFENHVYSAHSVVAKRVMDKKAAAAAAAASSSRSGYSAATESLLKPLKINDEITIIPQPAKPTAMRGGLRKTACQEADDSGSDTSL